MTDKHYGVPRSEHVRRHLPADMPEEQIRDAEANYFELIAILAGVAMREERARARQEDDD